MTVARAAAEVAASGAVAADLGQAVFVQAGGVAQVGPAAGAVKAVPAALVSSAKPAGAKLSAHSGERILVVMLLVAQVATPAA